MMTTQIPTFWLSGKSEVLLSKRDIPAWSFPTSILWGGGQELPIDRHSLGYILIFLFANLSLSEKDVWNSEKGTLPDLSGNILETLITDVGHFSQRISRTWNRASELVTGVGMFIFPLPIIKLV